MTRPPATSESEETTPRKTIHLDGRTLEGGGQLVRNAVALAALTGQAVQIDHVRANRPGKKGLKGTHVAAIRFLANVSGSTHTGVEVGSSSLTFVPPARPISDATTTTLRPDINIVLPTAGSVFLVFQALYPYLLHTATTPVRLCITGGTNVSFAPSFDYVAQVLAPNLARLGLPRLTVQLDRRGWATGPFSLGKVTMLVEPLPSRVQSQEGRGKLCFPPLDLGAYRRSGITQVDITVLAPDDRIAVKATRRPTAKDGRTSGSDGRRQPFSSPGRERASDSTTSSHSTVTIRQAVEQEVLRGLRRGLRRLPAWVFDSSTTCSSLSGEHEAGDLAERVPIRIHTSEATRHPAHLYIMIVAHTATGLKISHEALSGSRPGKAKKGHHDATEQPAAARGLAEQCVAGFLQELYDPHLQGSSRPGAHRPCVDAHLRDQMVIFEALGGVSGGGSGKEQEATGTEDQRFWSLHTRTAQWVCDEILGPNQ